MTTLVTLAVPDGAQAQEKRPNIVMLMTDDTGWSDFGAYGGGTTLGHPTPNVDRMAQEGATFTNWYGQASCTAGRASFITGRIPIRSALSIVVAPGDENYLRKETPTIAEAEPKPVGGGDGTESAVTSGLSSGGTTTLIGRAGSIKPSECGLSPEGMSQSSKASLLGQGRMIGNGLGGLDRFGES
jgi:Sulfatase